MTKYWPYLAIGTAFAGVACHTAGSSWMAQPLPGDSDDFESEAPPAPPPEKAASQRPRQTRVIGPMAERKRPRPAVQPRRKPTAKQLKGKVLGKFRNTYYDFPSENDHKGEPVALMNAKCKTIRDVPRGFYETLCVQGSGTLSDGTTVSFAKRDCKCAEICPRTDQKICFDALPRSEFPWGRGATGKAITPLLTVAVDSNVIPLGTPLYIPEYDGMPRDATHTAYHDGCFIAQDRGSRIKNKHVDVFTGHESITKLWNRLLPSNEGVTVVLESPRCARATATAAE